MAIGTRITELRGKESRRSFARRIGIAENTLRNYEEGLSLPNSDVVATICREFEVSAEWLISGAGPMKAGSASSDACNAARSWQPPVHLAQISSDDPWKNAKWQEVPVVGLANCGDGSWYTPGNLPLRATMPVDYPYTPNMFAVLAVGTSMQPEGIKQGYVLFCDPSAGIDVGDAVYVEKADGSASVKKYLKNDNGKIHLQGWSEPKDGTQKPYFEEVAQSQIKRLACVVVVKRKG